MDRQEELCQWLTRPSVARDFIEWARILPDDVILEPAAGEGALIPPDRGRVLAFEIDPERVEELRYWRPQATVVCADFLALPAPPEYVADVCLQNPPYSNSGEGVFIDKALNWAPRVCAHIRSGALHGKDRFEVCWSRVSVTRIAYLKFRPRYLAPFELPTPFTPAYDYIAIEAVRRTSDEPDRPEVTWVEWR